MLEIWLHSLRLSMLWDVWRRVKRQPIIEEPKQAVHKSLPLAMLSLVAGHLVPVSIAIMLISLNSHGYYIGGELAGPSGYDPVKLSGLQFAAKLHEITMLASLSVIVVGLIRQELVAGEGIPFGAVFGSLQFSSISYLFSKEFAGTLRAKFAKRIVKVRLVALLLVGALLALSLGPSSAILMRPQLDNWPAGGTDFYLNATTDEIWPSLVDALTIPTSCNSITMDTTCISRDWKSVLDQLLAYWPTLTNRTTMPEALQLSSPQSIRLMYNRETQGIYANNETLATTQMSNLADSLAEIGRLWAIAANELWNVSPKQPRRFKYRNDATYSLSGVFQPNTAAMCRAPGNSSQLLETLSNNEVQFPIAASLCEKTPRVAPYSLQPGQSTMIANYMDNSTTSPGLQFVELPPEQFGNNTIGTLVTFPPSWPGGSNLLTCAVDARWAPVTIKSTRDNMKVVSGHPTGWPSGALCNLLAPSVKVTPEWAQYLNPHIQNINQTVFHALAQSIGAHTSKWKDDIGFVQSVTESILTMLITNGLSRIASSATFQGKFNHCSNDNCGEICGRWCLDMMPKQSQELGYGGNIYNLSDIPDQSKLSKFTVHVDVNGYAYSLKGAAMLLSCAVLLSYCFLVAVHSTFVVITRTSSNAWDTVSEVTALAMQSQPTEVLKNTCAGFSTAAVFSRLVKVVKTGPAGDHLELDFGDYGRGYGERLVEDEFYG